MPRSVLPKKPSALIRLALQDLAKAERSPRFDIFMNRWFVPRAETCEVCLAGSVMAFSLKTGTDEEHDPDDFDRETEERLCALDSFRIGDIYDALNDHLNLEVPDYLAHHVDIIDYDDNPRKFKRQMRKMADVLESYNL